MRRMLAIVVVGAALSAFVFLALGAGGHEKGSPSYWVELDNAFGLVKGADLKIAGVRAGKITGMKVDMHTHRRAGRDQRGRQQGRLQLAAHGRLLRVQAAVADRRVLHRLPARHSRAPSSSPAARSPSPTPPRRSPPTWSRTSCACPTASGCG